MKKQIKIYNQKGEETGEMPLPSCFTVKCNELLVSRYLLYLRNCSREAIANTKNRGEVSGGGRKPWRQKGTGNARAGSSRSPIWVGGGVTFGPTNERNFRRKMNQKERTKAMTMILSKMAEKLVVVNKIEIEKPNTKSALSILNKLPLETEKTAIIISQKEPFVELSFRNLPFVSLLTAQNLNAEKVTNCHQLLVDVEALTYLGKKYDIS